MAEPMTKKQRAAMLENYFNRADHIFREIEDLIFEVQELHDQNEDLAPELEQIIIWLGKAQFEMANTRNFLQGDLMVSRDGPKLSGEEYAEVMKMLDEQMGNDGTSEKNAKLDD